MAVLAPAQRAPTMIASYILGLLPSHQPGTSMREGTPAHQPNHCRITAESMPPPTVDPSRSREPKQTKLRVRQPALRPERGITTGRRHRIALLAKRQRPAHNGTSRSREREQTKLQVWQPALRPERGITTGRPHKIA